MKKKLCVALMVVVAVVLLTVGMTRAANHPNLVGTWSGVVNFVGWNSTANPEFYYVSYVFSYEIQDQDLATGNFYGLESGYYHFTGNVATNKIVTIVEYDADGSYRIITGKVSGKKMTGTMQHFTPVQVDTGTFTFYRQ